MRNKIIAFILVMILANLSFPQNKIFLLDSEKVKDYLVLSSEQYKTIVPKIERLKAILEKDKKIIDDIKQRVRIDDEPDFFEKIGVRQGHEKRASRIDDLMDEIKELLNE